MASPRLTVTVAIVCLLLVTGYCLAGERPSFSLEDCVWNATDIVVTAQDSKSASTLTVLEVWHGSLSNGDRVVLAGLPNIPLTVRDAGPKKRRPATVTGDRVVLFLRRTERAASTKASEPATAKPARIAWVGADRFGIAQVSAVWIEAGNAYAFIQVMNPGPSVLISLDQTEGEFKTKTEAILAAQDNLHQAIAIRDPMPRAVALQPLVKSGYWWIRHTAVPELGACGEPAIPILQKMLRDGRSDQKAVVRAIAVASGRDAGAELTAILRDELDFWRKLGPTLKIGWWNNSDLAGRERYQNRYGLLGGSLGKLGELQYQPARESIVDLRRFWSSLPQLNDKSGLDQIIEECDRALAKVERRNGD